MPAMTVKDSLPQATPAAASAPASAPASSLVPDPARDGDDALLYLVRHGETLWNREGRMQGRLDSPLTRHGQDQARRMGQMLAQLIDDPGRFSLVSSPLGRAYHTMELIAAELGVGANQCRIDRRLKEMSWGQWDGLTLTEIERYFPQELTDRAARPWRYTPPGGESYSMVATRIRPFLEEAAEHGRLIIVAHGVVAQVLRGLYGGVPAEDIPTIDEPAEAVFRLQQGTVSTFETLRAA